MRAFAGRVTDMFALNDKGFVLQLTEVEGCPARGMKLDIGPKRCRVIEAGRISADGQPVSTRSCLTGQPVPPYGAVLVEWIGAVPTEKDVYGQRAEGNVL